MAGNPIRTLGRRTCSKHYPDTGFNRTGEDNMNEILHMLEVIGAIILLAWIVNSLVGKRS